MTYESAISFLNEMVRYWENRDTKGEDSQHWANVYNAKNCKDIANMISTLSPRVVETV